MNCKAGDLAVVVSGVPTENLGKVIRVTTLTDDEWWEYEGFLVPPWGGRADSVQDRCLRPIRDNPGQDETLTWQPTPTKETA